jgi:hypothetical protein
LIFLLLLPFFGLTQDYRLNLFKAIHDICYYGKGGYDYHIVYDMPIWLRNLTYKFISEQRQKENESYTKNTSDKGKKIDFNNITESKNIISQNGNPSYVTKASKK